MHLKGDVVIGSLMNKKIIVFIKGLDCEDEAKIIKARMLGLKGVVSFKVNTMAGSMNAVFDENLINEQDIIRAINETGMKARLKKEVKEKRHGGESRGF